MGKQKNENNEQSFKGWENPGQERIMDSSSEAVPSPSRTSDERIEAPDPYIESIGERPGDANPALGETLAHNEGTGSTADMLRAREAAEEQHLRQAGGHMYADQAPNTRPDEWEDADKGRPNWPNDRQEHPVEYMDSPRIEAAYGATGAGGGTGQDKQQLEAEVDRLTSYEGSVAGQAEARSGMPQIGAHPDEDIYERREMGRPSEPSEIDRLAHGMVNLPPEDEDGK
ncbi:MAG TPA: hypothetical protein VFR15_18015 [Chloroflexia bacterium]|nr:hypothetical protein [Chloroflexia bacterium]